MLQDYVNLAEASERGQSALILWTQNKQPGHAKCLSSRPQNCFQTSYSSCEPVSQPHAHAHACFKTLRPSRLRSVSACNAFHVFLTPLIIPQTVKFWVLSSYKRWAVVARKCGPRCRMSGPRYGSLYGSIRQTVPVLFGLFAGIMKWVTPTS